MGTVSIPRFLKALLWGCLAAAPMQALPEDIDIFTGASGSSAVNPNILIVLDNTSNWARQSQQWPGGVQQGQSEANAIKTVINGLSNSVNLGLMEFVTGGNANDNGGFIRYAISPMDSTNQAAFSTQLTTIYNNITDPNEKRNSNTEYGNLMYDIYNYFGGLNSYSPGGVLSTKADSNGYTSNYATFKSPMSSTNTCPDNYVIFIGNPNSSGPASDSAANTSALNSVGGSGSSTQLALPTFSTTTTTTTTPVGNTAACYASPAACSAVANTAEYPVQCDLSNYSGQCSCTTAVSSAGASACAPGTQSYSVIKSATTSTTTVSVGATTTTTATSNACYNNWSAARTGIEGAAADHGSLTCPATVTSGNTVTSYTCSYNAVNTATHSTCSTGKDKYQVVQTAAASVATTTTSAPVNTTLGYTSACYADASSCSTSDYSGQCSGSGVSCACGTPTATTTAACASGTSKYLVVGSNTTSALTASTTNTFPDTGPRNADEWARMLRQTGVTIPSTTTKKRITTYTIDVYNAQPNAETTSLLWNMAKYGGGKYYAAKNESEIAAALKAILVEIQAVNSTFASASLPVNATNRSQNENQVFIGMFRPDPDANPRWFGNVKRYKLIRSGSNIELGDADGKLAVNNNTGFVGDCANSFWTSDTGSYWQNISINPSPAGACSSTSFNAYSDKPDGPQVQKGGVAEVIRKGNNPTTTDTTPTWAVNRTVYTHTTSGGLVGFTNASTGLNNEALANFMLGQDVNDEKGTGATTTTRPSIHGDVIHSRPLPVNYGTTASSVTLYYGSNDGALRAVDADTGKERWAFIAPEFNSRLNRLSTNSPLVAYPNLASGITPVPTSKDYFWDGPIGLYQTATSDKVWIFPSMRRGGRMIYGLDVTNSATPTFKWKVGCPNFSDNTGCTSGMEGIGQTWSQPSVAFIKGYSTTVPVVIFGGGYDTCEDSGRSTGVLGTTCSKGGYVYVVNADTGALVKTFTSSTGKGISANVSMVDIDNDGYPDYAYAVDLGGAVFRIDFIDGPSTKNARAAADWTMTKVAATSGGMRKFQHAPTLLFSSNKVYVAMGSGDREHPLVTDYPYANPVTNRFYVYLDDLAVTPSTANDLDSPTTMANYTSNTDCSSPGITPAGTLKGWYMDLTANGVGEQVVTSAVIAGGNLTFSTNRAVASSSTTCTNALGEARGYWVNLANASGAIGVAGNCGGTRASLFVGGGLPPSPVIASSVTIDGTKSTVVIGAVQKNTGLANVAISPQNIAPDILSKRKRVYTYTKGEN